MAAKFYTGVDLCNQELLRARFQNLTAAPTTYAEGMVYYDNSTANNTKGRAVLRSTDSWRALAFLTDLDSYVLTTTYNGLSETVGKIDARLKSVETIFETDNDGTINKWNEVVAFLAGIDGDNLDSMLDTFALKATSITAGTGLTGTIKLDGTGTFALATVGTAGTYYKVTTDAYGRVTSGVKTLAIADVTDLQDSLDDMSSTISGHTTQISNHATRLNLVEEKATNNTTAITNILKLFTEGKANMAIADGNGNNIVSTYATKTALAATDENVEANATAISTLQGYFTSGVANNADKLDGHDSSYFATAANFNSLVTRVTTAEGEIDTLQANNTTLMTWYNDVGQHFKYDSVNKAWYLDGDFYTTGQNAAGGAGEEDGGGSGIILDYDSIVDALGYVPLQSSDLASYLTKTAASTTYATITTVTALTNRVSDLEGKATNVSYAASTATTSAVIGTLTLDGQANNISLRAAHVTEALGYTPTRKYTGTITSGGSVTQTFTHGFNTRDVIVQIFEPSAPYEQVYADVKVTSTTQVQITFAESPTKAYKVVIIG